MHLILDSRHSLSQMATEILMYGIDGMWRNEEIFAEGIGHGDELRETLSDELRR